jgi:flagellar biosynthesis GTPase FlhF
VVELLVLREQQLDAENRRRRQQEEEGERRRRREQQDAEDRRRRREEAEQRERRREAAEREARERAERRERRERLERRRRQEAKERAARERRERLEREERERAERVLRTPIPAAVTPLRTFDQRAVRPAGPATPLVATPTVPARRWLNAYTIVRIRGAVTTRGAYITLLSVKAPRGARAVVRCTGRRGSCPARRMSASSASSRRVLTFRRFHRRHLRAGTRLEVLVTKRGYVGKYTRFRIRARRAPTRVDLCLAARTNRPGRCA